VHAKGAHVQPTGAALRKGRLLSIFVFLGLILDFIVIFVRIEGDVFAVDLLATGHGGIGIGIALGLARVMPDRSGTDDEMLTHVIGHRLTELWEAKEEQAHLVWDVEHAIPHGPVRSPLVRQSFDVGTRLEAVMTVLFAIGTLGNHLGLVDLLDVHAVSPWWLGSSRERWLVIHPSLSDQMLD